MKGDVYLHSNFQFHDGEVGTKLFVVLNNPTKKQPYVVAKTTSNMRDQTYSLGCNPERKVFFVQQDTDGCFTQNTLIQLHELYEVSAEQFLIGSLQDHVISHKCTLSPLSVSQLVNCIKKLKDDISEKHFDLITAS